MMNNSKAMGVPDVCAPEDWNKGMEKVNTVYVAEVFNTKHGLDELTKEEREKFGINDDDIEGTREERQFRLWINSLEIENVYINDLFQDVRDGLVLLKVIHRIDPTVVDWSKVKEVTKNMFEVGFNCNEAFEAMKKMKLKLVGLGPKDIQDCHKQNILAFVW